MAATFLAGTPSPVGWVKWDGATWREIIGPADVRSVPRSRGVRAFGLVIRTILPDNARPEGPLTFQRVGRSVHIPVVWERDGQFPGQLRGGTSIEVNTDLPARDRVDEVDVLAANAVHETVSDGEFMGPDFAQLHRIFSIGARVQPMVAEGAGDTMPAPDGRDA